MVSGGETPILEVIMALTKSGHSEGQGFLTEALRTINTRGSVVQASRLSILRFKKRLNLSCLAREMEYWNMVYLRIA